MTWPIRRTLPPGLAHYLWVSLVLGLCMNSLGHLLCIAHFLYWWQVVTCYWGYVVPVALLVRGRSGWDQLAWGIVSMVPLELAGYGLGSSVACPGNLLDRFLGPHDFALAMVAIGGPIPWLLNTVVAWLRAGGAAAGETRVGTEDVH